MAEPRTDATRLADVTLPELRRTIVTAALLLAVLYLLIGMLGSVLLAAVLGIVVGIYLGTVARWIGGRIGSPTMGAVSALLLLLLPLVVVLVYGYLELERAASYLRENAGDVAGEIHEALTRLPLVGDLAALSTIRRGIDSAAGLATGIPGEIQGLVGGFLVAAAVLLFTAFYILTRSDDIIEYVRGSIPPRYSALTETLESNARGVLYGTIFAVLVTQAAKAIALLILFLALGVPLPVTLAVLAFFVGFFPIVGSWTVYLPAAAYLLIFDHSPIRAVILVAGGFAICTLFLSLYVRPKLAAERSGVLDFYWMFLGLVAGVYAFGVPGVIVGPLLIGLLKAIIDTVRAREVWESNATGEEEPEAQVLTEEKLEG